MATEVIRSFGAAGNGRDYTSLATWQADFQQNLTLATGNDTKPILEIYDDWPGDPLGNNESVVLSGAVCDPATDNIFVWRPATGEGFPPTIDTTPAFAGWTGAKLTRGGAGNTVLTIGLNQFIHIEDLALVNTRTASNSNADTATWLQGGSLQAERCFISTYGGQAHTEESTATSWPSYFRSCVFTREVATSPGFQRAVYRGYGIASLEACSIIMPAPTTLNSGDILQDRGVSTLNMSDTVVYNIIGTYSSFNAIVGTNNASDLTPGGTSPVIGVVDDADFVSVSTGNFNLAPSSLLEDAGATLPNFDYDVVNYTRTGTWDVGSFEIQGAPAGAVLDTPTVTAIAQTTATIGLSLIHI